MTEKVIYFLLVLDTFGGSYFLTFTQVKPFWFVLPSHAEIAGMMMNFRTV